MEHYIRKEALNIESAAIENIAYQIKDLNELMRELIDILKQIQDKDR